MEMKSLMRLACLGAVAMTFVACEEDKHICTLPSFAGFRIEPTVWNAGDSVTILTKDYNEVYDADKSNPYIGIRLPDDFRGRMAKINFSVQYSYSATAPQSAPSGSNSGQSGLYGSITTTAASQLYGTGRGSYTLSW